MDSWGTDGGGPGFGFDVVGNKESQFFEEE